MTIHLVQSWETLFKISNRYSVPVALLKEANDLIVNQLFEGQILVIPELPSSMNRSLPATFNTTTEWYTVRAGDTLYKIAQRFGTRVDLLKSMNKMRSSALSVGQRMKVRVVKAPGSDTNTGGGQGLQNYFVKAGDSLYKIAKYFGITTDHLKRLNSLISNNLAIGQKLFVPGKTETKKPTYEEEVYHVKPGDTLFGLALLFNVGVHDLKSWNKLLSSILNVGQRLLVKKRVKNTGSQGGSNNTNTSPNDGVNLKEEAISYTVTHGDSLWGISKKFGVTIEGLVKWNKLRNNVVKPEQVLTVGYAPVTTPLSEDMQVTGALQFRYTMALKGSVGGAGSQNVAADVKYVQNELLRLGFLSATAHNKEKPQTASHQKVSSQQLLQTIAGIKAFEATMLNTDFPTGVIMPKSTANMVLQTAMPMLSQTRLSLVKQERKAFKLINSTAFGVLKNGISGHVGETNFGNNPTDVGIIQSALVRMGHLVSWHGETPTSTQAVNKRNLPRTIHAIKELQRRYVVYWKDKPDLMPTTQFVHGVVSKDDLTFYVLKNFIAYQLSFPDVMNPSVRAKVKFHNFPKSKFVANSQGISYIGRVTPNTLSLPEYRSIGLNHIQAKALKYVSEHEGNFDAINSYDKAMFSFGFIQFAGDKGGLAPMMALCKHQYPKEFKAHFQDYGVDVAYSIEDGKVKYCHMSVVDVANKQVKRHNSAFQVLQADKVLTGVFIRAAYYKSIQLAQVSSAKQRYVLAAMDIELDLDLPFISGKIPVTDIVRSEMAITVLIDLTVNQWIVRTGNYFAKA
ncbi:MAG: LysM peptidoglycan-binding domain-containing protein, partial [Chitinophagales bacterium]